MTTTATTTTARVQTLRAITNCLQDLMFDTYNHRDFTIALFMINHEDWLEDFVDDKELADEDVINILDSAYDAYLKVEEEILTRELVYSAYRASGE